MRRQRRPAFLKVRAGHAGRLQFTFRRQFTRRTARQVARKRRDPTSATRPKSPAQTSVVYFRQSQSGNDNNAACPDPPAGLYVVRTTTPRLSALLSVRKPTLMYKLFRPTMTNAQTLSVLLLLLGFLTTANHAAPKTANDSELVNEDEYYDYEEETDNEFEAQRRQTLQRAPQQQQSFGGGVGGGVGVGGGGILPPGGNMQPNPLRLPNSMMALPPAGAAPGRWVQPMGNGVPVAASGQPGQANRFVLMPFDPRSSSPVNAVPRAAAVPAAQPQRPSAPIEPSVHPAGSGQVNSPFGALPGAPLTPNAAQRLIILPSAGGNGQQPLLIPQPQQQPQPQPHPRPQFPAPNPQPAVNTRPASGTPYRPVAPPPPPQPHQQTFSTVRQPPPSPAAGVDESPALVPEMGAGQSRPPFVAGQTAQKVNLMQQLQPQRQATILPASTSFVGQTGRGAAEADGDDDDEDDTQPEPLSKSVGIGRPIGVHTPHGKLLLEPHLENFCDLRQFSDDQLAARNLQRVEYFIANLTCSRYFYECAVGQTFLLNCTSKDQVFDINIVNCNFKYNVKTCTEYDHILHCTISEQCGADQFACCSPPQQCLPYAKRCDGIADCPDGDDENNCPACNADEFPCVKSGKCIPWEKRCNGVPDECFDQTDLDEQNCSGCAADKFPCTRSIDPISQSPVCIDPSLRCNGIRECPRGEDELNCTQWCDGYEDCLDGSDEKYCVY